MLGPEDLVLCAGTLARASFAERVAAADEAGFSAISLFATDYRRAREGGLSDADMRAMLEDRGLAIAELDPLMRWVPGASLGAEANERGADFFRTREADFYAIADALGARSINTVLVTDAVIEPAVIAEAFAGLCERAAEHGLLVHLESLPWTQIPDVPAALEIVELADRPNGGIMLDSWHHFRSRVGNQALREVPGERILAVQLSDAPADPEPDPVEETTRRRRLPGQGDIDLPGLVNILDRAGSPAPIGVEVFSDSLVQLPAREAARRAAEATRAVLKRARGV